MRIEFIWDEFMKRDLISPKVNIVSDWPLTDQALTPIVYCNI